MRAYRLHWDAKDGWLVDTDLPLPALQLEKLISWAIPKQVDRYRALPTGDKRRELERAIELLKKGAVRQRVLPNRSGETNLIKA